MNLKKKPEYVKNWAYQTFSNNLTKKGECLEQGFSTLFYKSEERVRASRHFYMNLKEGKPLEQEFPLFYYKSEENGNGLNKDYQSFPWIWKMEKPLEQILTFYVNFKMGNIQ